jgi:acyl dehydratase
MNLARLLEADFPVLEERYGIDRVILYALAIGVGHDPVDPRQLQYVYEDGLRAFPTLPLVLAHPGFWIADEAFGIDWKAVLHGEQSIEIHRPVPTEGHVVARLRVTDVVDKGPTVGALVYSERTIEMADSGERVATMRSTTVCRNDGGQGGTGTVVRPSRPRPDGPPDAVVSLPTLPQSALLYRLTGDRNPLHADPMIALAGGFHRPILHGLCTFGVAAHAIVQEACDYDDRRLTGIEARFVAPVTPGSTLVTRLWNGPGAVQFHMTEGIEGPTVLSNGWATIG